MDKLKNKVVIITGGGKGIGRETANIFANHGANVIITGRTESALSETANRIKLQGGHCEYIVGDVTSVADCQKIVETVNKNYQRIDVLINNAGMSMRGLFVDTDLELFRKIIDINFMGAVQMTKLALPHLIASKGNIVFVSSLSALKGIPGIAPYGAAKMALNGLSESIRAELYPHGVHVGIVHVGFTENDPNKKIYSSKGELIPLKRDKNNDTQAGVAQKIFKAVVRRKAVMILTFQGKVANFMYRVFPRFSSYLLRKFALKNARNK